MEKLDLTRFVRGAVDMVIALILGPFGLATRYASPHSPPAKLDSDKFGDSRRAKPDGLIESCTQGVGAQPQNSFRWGSGGSSSQQGLGRSPTVGTPPDYATVMLLYCSHRYCISSLYLLHSDMHFFKSAFGSTPVVIISNFRCGHDSLLL